MGEMTSAPHETAIAESYDKPVFITHCNIIKTILHHCADRDDVVLCANLIAPEGYGEIIGGSSIVHDLELLKQD
ncbi:hypothetical protein ACEQPO_17220 [Bacillus sp. SL00103]